MTYSLKKFGIVFVIFIICFMVCTMISEAATAGSIKDAVNKTDGIQVSWNLYSSGSGYQVFRKEGTSAWTMVQEITDCNADSWIDEDTVNGTKYVYKVYPVKGSKVLTNNITKKMYRITRPSIKAESCCTGQFTVSSRKNSRISGYKVLYAEDQTFKDCTVKYISGKSLDKTFGEMPKGGQYYVKLKAYKKVNGIKYYSSYSYRKKVVIKKIHTAYLTKQETRLKKSLKSGASYITVPYMEEIVITDNISTSSSGSRYKLKYNGKVYYLWVDTGDRKFTDEKSTFTYTADSKKAQKVVDKAVAIRNMDTVYIRSAKVSSGTKTKDGLAFDCSGLVRYVYSKAAGYSLPKTADKIYRLKSVSGKSIKTVCRGEWNPDQLKAGDIICFDESGSGKCTHVGIYLGNNEFCHCVKKYGVTISPMEGCWERYFKAVKRMI